MSSLTLSLHNIQRSTKLQCKCEKILLFKSVDGFKHGKQYSICDVCSERTLIESLSQSSSNSE